MTVEPKARHRIFLVLETLALLLCLLMLATRGHSEERAEVAVLKNRADQIERHLDNTDRDVSRLNEKVNALSNDLSEKSGEERAAWAGLGLLSTFGIVVQFRAKKAP